MMLRTYRATLLLLPLLTIVVACGEPTAPGAHGPASVFSMAEQGRPVQLVTCPSKEFVLSFAMLGPQGGTMTGGPVTMDVPPGALPTGRLFVISVPRSRYLEMQIAAVGVEHFIFDLPVTITVDYSRCDLDQLDEQSLTAWFVDTQSLLPIEPMATEDDRLARRAVFITDHLSRYALAQ